MQQSRRYALRETMTVGALCSAAYDGRRLQAPALLFEGASGHSDRPFALAGSSVVGHYAWRCDMLLLFAPVTNKVENVSERFGVPTVY